MTPSSAYRLGYGAGRTGENISVWTGGPTAGKVPLILCHGFLGTALQWYDTITDPITVATGTARAGLVALGPDLGPNTDPLRLDGQNNWGHDDVVETGGAIDDAIAWAATNLGTRTDKVGIYGTSMGGTGLNWCWRNATKLAAAAFTIPCVALAGLHDRNPIGLATYVELAYSLEGGYLAALPDHDPSHPTNLAKLALIADRIHLWYSGNDNVIAASEVEAFAAATGVEATNVGNFGHSLAWDQQLVLDWLIPRLWWA